MRYLLLIVFLSLSVAGFSQGGNDNLRSARFILPDTFANNGAEVCLPVTTQFFTSGYKFGFAIVWEPSTQAFITDIRNFNPAINAVRSFNRANNVDETAAAAGLISVSWSSLAPDEPCEDVRGVTLPANSVLFEVCFEVSGPPASNIEVRFFDKPDTDPDPNVDNSIPIDFQKTGQCGMTTEVFPSTQNGSVTIDRRPLIWEVQDRPGDYGTGDTYCVDIVAKSGFDDLLGFQYVLAFDTSVLRVSSVDANQDLVAHTNGSYQAGPDGLFLNASWSLLSRDGVSLPDDTRLVTVCFEVVGDCSSRTDVEIGGDFDPDDLNARPTEATGGAPLNLNIPVVEDGVRLIVDDCGTGFDVVLDCPDGPVAFMSEICIPVRAGDNFTDMIKIDYLIKWDPNILEFSRIANPRPSSGLIIADVFDTSQSGDGTLIFEWERRPNRPISLSPDEVFYEVCFNVVGFSGTSPLLVTNFRNNIENTTTFIDGIDPTNCAVTVEDQDGVNMIFPRNVGIRELEESCFDLTVDNFTEVTSVNVLVAVPSFSTFTVGNSVVPGVTITNLGGLVNITYDGTPFSLPNGDALATICVTGDEGITPGDCDPIQLSFNPQVSKIVEETEQAVTVNQNIGEGCVLFPNGFGLQVNDATGVIDSTICVPVTVTEFEGILSADVDFIFDRTNLTFSSIELSGAWAGLTVGDFDVSMAPAGVIKLDWTGAGAGASINDEDPVLVFELCFTTNLDPGCSDLVPRNGNDPATTTTLGTGSIVYEEGEVCVEDRIVVNSVTFTPASCAGEDDACLIFDLAPRANNEDLFIRTSNPTRIGNNGEVCDLLPGMQRYTIYNINGTAILTDSIMIGVDPANVAVADAGADRALDCGSGNAVLNGRNNEGAEYILFYVINEMGETRRVDQGNIAGGSYTERVSEFGTYILEVISEAGCSAFDTVLVTNSQTPMAVIANEDPMITCGMNTLTLDSEGSSTGDNVSYQWWSTSPGGELITQLGTEPTQPVMEGGFYRLIVTFTNLNCSDSTSIRVMADDNLPTSELNTQYFLDCDGAPLDLTTGPFNPTYVYSWVDLANNSVLSTDNVLENVREPIELAVTIESPDNMCSRTDTVSVIASEGAPTIAFPDDRRTFFLNCNPDTTLITPTYGNTTEDTRYLWRSADGGRVVISDIDNAEARVVAAGTYTIIANNGSCVDSLIIQVLPGPVPAVSAGEDKSLDCGSSLTLTGEATLAGTDPEFSFQWTSNGMNVTAGAAESVSVDQPGIYVFTATIVATGCSASDTVEVVAPTGFPEYDLVDTIGGLGCAPSTVGIAVASPAGEYDYRWENPAGTEISTNRSASADAPGFYSVTITNPATNCTAVDSIFVDDDQADPPFVAFVRNNIDITCESGRAVIDATPSVSGDRYEYVFSVVSGGEPITNINNDSLVVNSPGVYRLTITDRITNCVNSRDIEVTDSRELPGASSIGEPVLDCETREVTIGIDIDQQPNDFDIRWFGPPGAPALPSDTNRIAVTLGGTYNAVIINAQTSCTNTVIIRVEDLQDSIAMIVFDTVAPFDCSASTVTIDASATELRGDGSTIAWMSLDGNNVTPATGSLIVEVDGPGDYELAVTDVTGCTIRDTVSVAAANNTPFATIEQDATVSCGGEAVVLNTDGSSTGEAFTYEWTILGDAGNIVSGANTPNASIDAPGTYQFVILNVENMCSDTATTTVEVEGLEAADIGADFTTCDLETEIMGNLPAGTSGSFTVLDTEGGSIVVDENVATVTIGRGILIAYTLSAVGCEDYSTDSIRIMPEAIPVANDDFLEITGTATTGSINVLDNDIRTGPVTVRLLNEPTFGTVVSNLNGTITFESVPGLTDVTTIRYEVCSNVCTDLCAEAVLTISASATGTPTVYNVFTPNGDGMNDMFIFDILNFNADEYPDNEIVIFNRWGDVVYEAGPYLNDWDGTSKDGTDLPEGTYYYILRLDIGEGDIIRGDVTILR